MNEIIRWKRPEDEMPDEEFLVLILDKNGEASTAIVDAGVWHDYPRCNALGLNDQAAIDAPVLWADMPSGAVEANIDIRTTADKIRNLWVLAMELQQEVARQVSSGDLHVGWAYHDMGEAAVYLLRARNQMLSVEEEHRA